MTANSNSELEDEQRRSQVTGAEGGTDDVHPDNQMSDSHRPSPERSKTTWTTGEKYGVGTAQTRDSRVWFTLTEGALTELRFPRVDLMNVRLVDFLVADQDSGYTARTHVESRTSDDTATLEREADICEPDALVYGHRILETAEGRHWELSTEYCTDPATDSVALDVEFESEDSHSYDLYVVAETAPSGYMAGTSGTRVSDGDGFAATAWKSGDAETAIRDENGASYEIATALATSDGFEWASASELDSPELRRLVDHGKRHENRSDAGGGRVLIGQIGSALGQASKTIALGFAEDGETEKALSCARQTLERGYEAVREFYVAGWASYLADRPVPEVVDGDPDLEAQYKTAVQVLKAVESKQFPGASVASPSVPWGDAVDATEPRDYGYNFTWSRDLYQVVTALQVVGDIESATESLEYLYEYQQRENGFLPQNTHLDGRTRWGGEQLDNVAYPAVIAYQLDRELPGGLTDTDVTYEDVRRSCEYLLREGPRSEQERWEEEDGYSPSTIAAEVAGLACASVLAEQAGEHADALAYLAHADQWRRRVTDWCVTNTGTDSHSPPYYIRISADGKPDEPTQRSLANNGPTLDERSIIDAGFLELVRLGLYDHEDRLIENSVDVVDETIRVDTPHGPCWYRYNGDGYGELGAEEPDVGGPWEMDRNGQGRLWPIFTGERGEYELLRGTSEGALAPAQLLQTMAGFANSGRMIPEQVWDREEPTAFGWEFGAGTGGATPLAWSMAQFVRLAHSIDAGAPVERPRFLRERYLEGNPASPELSIRSVADGDGATEIRGWTDADEVVCWTPAGSWLVADTGGEFTCSLPADCQECAVVGATAGDLEEVETTIQRLEVSEWE